MKKILLHIFTCCMLIHLVSENIFKCYKPQMKSELNGFVQVNNLEDESDILSFKIRNPHFSLHPKTVFSYTDVSLLYAKCPHICAPLSIFSPPPNFC